jgi:hypothetical protein
VIAEIIINGNVASVLLRLQSFATAQTLSAKVSSAGVLVPFALQKERHVLAKDGKDVRRTICLRNYTTLQKYLPCRGMRRKGLSEGQTVKKPLLYTNLTLNPLFCKSVFISEGFAICTT